MKCVGINFEFDLVEIVEIFILKWYIGIQFYLEYSSIVLYLYLLFVLFIKVVIDK